MFILENLKILKNTPIIAKNFSNQILEKIVSNMKTIKFAPNEIIY